MPVTRKKIYLLFKRVTPIRGIEFQDSVTDTHVLKDYSFDTPPPSDEFTNATHRLSIYEDWDLEVPVLGVEFQDSVTDTHVLKDYSFDTPPPSDEFTNAAHRLSIYEDFVYAIVVDIDIIIRGDDEQLVVSPNLGTPYSTVDGISILSGPRT